jgi:hypothetical protein
MALVGQRRGVCKAMEGRLFDVKFPKHKTEEARILSSKLYLTFQQLQYYGFLRI